MINVKIGEVRLSDEIGEEGGLKFWKKQTLFTIRYEIPTFSSAGPFFEKKSRKFQPEAEILEIFSIEVVPNLNPLG